MSKGFQGPTLRQSGLRGHAYLLVLNVEAKEIKRINSWDKVCPLLILKRNFECHVTENNPCPCLISMLYSGIFFIS